MLSWLHLPQVSSSVPHSLIMWGDGRGHGPSAKLGLRIPSPWSAPYHQLPWPGILVCVGGMGALHLCRVLCPSGCQKHSEVIIWRRETL